MLCHCSDSGKSEDENELPRTRKSSKVERGRGGRGRLVHGRGRGHGHGQQVHSSQDNGQPSAPNSSSDMNWSEQGATPQQFDFQGTSGVKATVTDWSDPYSIFCIFFTTSLIEMIVQETNRYADEMLPHTKTVWAPVSADDIMCFLASLLMMGNVRKPTLKSYWSTDTMSSTPIFSMILSRNRFLAINKLLPFVNNSIVDPVSDHLRKIRPVVDHMRDVFSRSFLPSRCVH